MQKLKVISISLLFFGFYIINSEEPIKRKHPIYNIFKQDLDRKERLEMRYFRKRMADYIGNITVGAVACLAVKAFKPAWIPQTIGGSIGLLIGSYITHNYTLRKKYYPPV